MRKDALRSPRLILAGLLLLAAGLRLVHLDAPPIGRHAWRQADTAAVARNFHERGYRLLLPEVDWGPAGRDGTPGPTAAGMEFPIYQFATAALYAVFGANVLWARLLSVIGSVIGVFFLHRLVELQIDRRTADWSCFLYAVLPLSVYYGRTIQPEPWLIGASIAGVYWFARWVRSDRLPHLALSVACVALACLLKFALYLGLPLLYLAWTRHGARSLRQWRLWIAAVLMVSPCLAWYGYAASLARETGVGYGVASQGLLANWDVILTLGFYNDLFFRQIAERHVTWVGFVVLLIGAVLPRRTRGEHLFDAWALAVLIYFFLAANLNAIHEYYQIPLIPPASVFMAKVFARYWTVHRAILLPTMIAILVLGGWRYWSYLERERPGASPDVRIAEVIAEHTGRHDPVVTATRRPVWLYLSHRQGWLQPVDLVNTEWIRWRVAQGARFLAGRRSMLATESQRRALEDLVETYEVAYDDGENFLLRLAP